MRFLAINKKPKRRVEIPEFTGGINLRDNPIQCNDNQLTELVNMWYFDGTLRTRPGVKSKRHQDFNKNEPIGNYSLEDKVYENIFRTISGEPQKLAVCIIKHRNEANVIQKLTFNFMWCGKTNSEILPSIEILGQQELSNYLVYNFNNTLYCFVKTSVNKYIYCSENGSDWRIIGIQDVYIPTIMIHCKASHLLSEYNAWTTENIGVNYESYNILGDYYKMVYSTVNRSADVEDDNYRMIYGIIGDTFDDKYKGYTVKAEYIDKNGVTQCHTVTLLGTKDEKLLQGWWAVEENPTASDGLKMLVCARQIKFVKKDTTTYACATLKKEDYIEDNMVITAPYLSDSKDKVFNMTQSEWFGGTSEGLSGGTRLFLCGNKNIKDKASVIWSGLEQPLYFPEYACFNVGDTSKATTGFGKQSDMLVIFKENEIWCTKYYQNTNITAQDLIDQTVMDIQSSAVYFPLTRISSEIGCLYPDTVQLCRNRLVWLGNDKKVYSLNSENQYNEKNVYPLSEMIDKRIKGRNITNPVAFNWNGYYCLKNEKEIYLMDYNSYGYIYSSSHSKTEDSNERISWYIWEFEEDNRLFVCDEELLSIKFNIRGENGTVLRQSIYEFISGLSKDELNDGSTKTIKSVFQTKIFDFGESNSYKNICSVGLSLGYNGGGEIYVTFLTDGGDEQTCLVLDDAAEERSAVFTKSRILTPAICQVLRFAIRIECESDVLIDGLNIDYRVLGRAM